MKKLSICIPTYNRSDFVISQLRFLKEDTLPYKDIIEIIVADNCSLGNHRDVLINYHLLNDFFDLKLNSVNLGAIGNFHYLLENAHSEYIWFVSDDDILLDGVVERIIKIINTNDSISYLFLNYNAFIKNPEVISCKLNLLGYSGYLLEGKQCVIDLFKECGTVSMFITSCVYSTAPLKAICSARTKRLLIDPLLFSFILALGPIYVENDVFVLERCNAPTWENEIVPIFSWQVQGGLLELLDHSYIKKDIIDMIYSMYASNRGNYLRMLLQAPFELKMRIIYILGFKQILLLFLYLKNFIHIRVNKIRY